MFIVQCRVRSMPLQVRSLPHLGLALQDRTLLASDAIRQINQQPHTFNIKLGHLKTSFFMLNSENFHPESR